VANDTPVEAAKAELERAQQLDSSIREQAAAAPKPSGQHADAPYSLATELQNKGKDVAKYVDGQPPSGNSGLQAELGGKATKVKTYLEKQ
jgi:hypothetical protein